MLDGPLRPNSGFRIEPHSRPNSTVLQLIARHTLAGLVAQSIQSSNVALAPAHGFPEETPRFGSTATSRQLSDEALVLATTTAADSLFGKLATRAADDWARRRLAHQRIEIQHRVKAG